MELSKKSKKRNQGYIKLLNGPHVTNQIKVESFFGVI